MSPWCFCQYLLFAHVYSPQLILYTAGFGSSIKQIPAFWGSCWLWQALAQHPTCLACNSEVLDTHSHCCSCEHRILAAVVADSEQASGGTSSLQLQCQNAELHGRVAIVNKLL